jgi:hypothetical protein
LPPSQAPPPITNDTTAAGRIGPSFDCSKATQPLAQMICRSPNLARADLEFVQAYQALRQQIGDAGQAQLRQEALDFQSSVLQLCGVPASGSVAGSPDCVGAQYDRQRSVWLSRLRGPASEEANRPIERHIGLQSDLQKLGYLPATATIDGVYGPATRVAIIAWQNASGRSATGFFADAEAECGWRPPIASTPPWFNKQERL